jgi:hypothetical protein
MAAGRVGDCDGVEDNVQGLVLLAFDFGDLDELVVRLDDQGRGVAVYPCRREIPTA